MSPAAWHLHDTVVSPPQLLNVNKCSIREICTVVRIIMKATRASARLQSRGLPGLGRRPRRLAPVSSDDVPSGPASSDDDDPGPYIAGLLAVLTQLRQEAAEAAAVQSTLLQVMVAVKATMLNATNTKTLVEEGQGGRSRASRHLRAPHPRRSRPCRHHLQPPAPPLSPLPPPQPAPVILLLSLHPTFIRRTGHKQRFTNFPGAGR